MVKFVQTHSFIHILFAQLIIILALCTYESFPVGSQNIAQIILNKSLWADSQTAKQRQKAVRKAIWFMQYSSYRASELTSTTSLNTCTMIPALIHADFYRKHRNYPMMLFWLGRATSGTLYPESQKAVRLPYSVSIDTDGNIILPWDSHNWHFRTDSNVINNVQTDTKGSVVLSYFNRPNVRDKMIYTWSQPIALSYWHQLNLKVKVAVGSYLTVESHTKSIGRHLEYFKGDGQWHEFIFDLDNENVLRFIYISLSEEKDTQSVKYQVHAQPIKLKLTDDVQKCD